MEPLNITLAYLLDLALGDPRWFFHPVKIMGRLINFLEAKLRTGEQRVILRIKGAILTLIVTGASALGVYLILFFLAKINPLAGGIAWVVLAYTSLATKDLFLHARDVLTSIQAGNIEQARSKLSYMVGRDTQHLCEKEIIRASVESIAENTSDGIIAPLFYLILGGPVLAIAYKAVNTLDSMLGHKNEKYRDFGWFSARLDDLANFVPARLSALLISFSSFIQGKSPRASLAVTIKDGNKHLSPNAGYPEAAMAGALGIRLGGASRYGGKLCLKPHIGEEKNPIHPGLINQAFAITFTSSIIMVSIGALLKWAI